MDKQKTVRVLGSLVCLLAFLGVSCTKQAPAPFANTVANTNAASANTAEPVTWTLGKNNTWVASSTPPSCPDPVVFAPPTDLSRVTSILYPGQIRGNAYKASGGFRFPEGRNDATVTIPFDATIVRGSRSVRDGENQYSFEFVNPCGISYLIGHLLELSPKFLAVANALPLINGFATQQFFDVTPPVQVTAGEVLATKVGYALQKNAFFELSVFDLRHKNGLTIRPQWAKQYGDEFDQYAICPFDLLPPRDEVYLKSLYSSTVESGIWSDYCQ